MKDTCSSVSTTALPVALEIDGTVAYFGWPKSRDGFGQLSIRFADGEIRICTPAECERFVNSLSHYYFVPSKEWAQAFGFAGNPIKPYQAMAKAGGGTLV